MCKIAGFFSVLFLGLSVGVGAFAQTAVGVGAVTPPAGTEDADMTKEKLFPVGNGVGLTHFRVVMPGVLYRGGTEGPRERRWTPPAAAKSISPGAMQSRLFAGGVRVSNRMEWNPKCQLRRQCAAI